VVALADTTGNVAERYDYTPYGVLLVLEGNFAIKSGGSEFGNAYTYTGRRFDSETEIYYYRNRYYHAQLGRFCSRDPLGYVDGWNLYEYVKSKPIDYVDPTGKAVPVVVVVGGVALFIYAWAKCLSAMKEWRDNCKANIPKCDDGCMDAGELSDCLADQNEKKLDCIIDADAVFENCIQAVYTIPPI